MQFVGVVVGIVALGAAWVGEPKRVAHILRSAHVRCCEHQFGVDHREGRLLLLVVAGRAAHRRCILLRLCRCSGLLLLPFDA